MFYKSIIMSAFVSVSVLITSSCSIIENEKCLMLPEAPNSPQEHYINNYHKKSCDINTVFANNNPIELAFVRRTILEGYIINENINKIRDIYDIVFLLRARELYHQNFAIEQIFDDCVGALIYSADLQKNDRVSFCQRIVYSRAFLNDETLAYYLEDSICLSYRPDWLGFMQRSTAPGPGPGRRVIAFSGVIDYWSSYQC